MGHNWMGTGMKEKRFWLPVVLLLGIGVVFLVRSQTGVDAPRKSGPEKPVPGVDPKPHDQDPDPISIPVLPRYTAPPGRVLLYDVSLVTTMNLMIDLELQEGQVPAAQTVTMRLTGLLECAGYRSKHQEDLLIGYRFREVAIKSDQVPMDAMMTRLINEQLREEFFVTMTPRGKIRKFHHASSVLFQLQGWEKALLINGRIILPEKRVPDWEEREEDQTGPFVALYEETSEGDSTAEMSVSKRKEYYESVSTRALTGGSEGGDIMAFPAGKTDSVFLLQEGYNSLVDQNETMEIIGEGFGPGTSVATRTLLRLLEVYHDEKRAGKSAEVMARTLTGMEASGFRGGQAEIDHENQQQIERWEKEAGDHTVDEIIATLRHLIETGKMNGREAYDAILILAALIALDDARAVELQSLIQGETNLELLEMVTNALGNAGTPAAQKVLVETAADPNIDLRIRTSALISFAPPMTPSPEAEEALRAMVDPGDELNLGTNSLYILGVMSNRLATRDPERAMEIVQYILKQEKAFRDANQVRFFLGAVANSGNPAAYETILPYLGSADDLTRIEAVVAMGMMPQKEAIPHLAQAMSDKSAAVRISAIQAAQARSAHSGLPGKVKNLLQKDPDSNVRKEALNYLVTTSSDPGVLRALLQQVASSDPDPDLRKAATEALEAQ